MVLRINETLLLNSINESKHLFLQLLKTNTTNAFI